MATTDFLPFGTGGGANVITQAVYAALAARGAGFSAGVATSAQLNKVWRQSSMIAAAVGTYLANHNITTVDDGNLTTLTAAIQQALDGNVTAITSTPFAVTPDMAGLLTVDATAGNIVINLPAGSTMKMMELLFNRLDSTANTVTINFNGSDALDGATSVLLNKHLGIVSNGGTPATFYHTIPDVATLAEYIAGTDPQKITPPALIYTMSPVQGAVKNLYASANGTGANITITADEIVLESAANKYYTARTVSLTLNTAGSGANGLDSAPGTPIAANTWYSMWVIYNPTTNTVAALCSTSATAPTLPAGYTHKARVGWFRTDGTANKYPLGFLQRGRRVSYVVAAGSNVTGLPVMASGAQGWPAAIAVANFVPPTALSVSFFAINNATGGGPTLMYMAPNSSYTNSITATNCAPFFINNNANGAQAGEFVLESSNIYCSVAAAPGLIQCKGWEDNL